MDNERRLGGADTGSRLVSCIVPGACLLMIAASTASGVPLGLPPLSDKAGEAPNIHLVELGRRLFFDPALSIDGKISCSSCHLPNRQFADGRARALGHAGRSGTRNTPSLLNVAYLSNLFWDGRARNLESQARLPLTNALEHGFPSDDAIIAAVNGNPRYQQEFKMAFRASPGRISVDQIAQAIAGYERTLLTGNSPFDQYLYGNDRQAMSGPAVRGFELFRGRAGCATCHAIGDSSALLTDQQFHPSPVRLSDDVTEHLSRLAQELTAIKTRSGFSELNQRIASDSSVAALGRFVVTLDPVDIGKFRTPSLRNVTLTAPYMHDGSVATLAEAIDLELYGRGGTDEQPIVLTAQERAELMAFLEALSSPETADIAQRFRHSH